MTELNNVNLKLAVNLLYYDMTEPNDFNLRLAVD